MNISHINQEQVIFDALGFWPMPKKRIRSPFRNDRTPSAYFDYKKGKLVFFDWADPDNNKLDCWDIYMRAKNCTFAEAVRGYDVAPKVDLPRFYMDDEEVRIHFDVCDYTEEAEDYWAQFGITTKQLASDGVFQCSYYRFNSKMGKELFIEKEPEDICFAMVLKCPLGGERTKIYRPLAKDKKHKWTSDFTPDMFWYNRCGAEMSSSVFIGSSYKDIRVVGNLYDVDCIAPAVSETCNASTLAGMPLMKLLKKYEEVIVGMDFDSAGHKSMHQWSKALKFHSINHRLRLVKELSDGNGGSIKDYADLYKYDQNEFYIKLSSL